MEDDYYTDDYEEYMDVKPRPRHKHRPTNRKASQQGKQPKRESYVPPPPPEPKDLSIPYARLLNLKVLGLGIGDDTPVKIRTAYKRLALQYHPDKNGAPTAVEIFKKIVLAYEALCA